MRKIVFGLLAAAAIVPATSATAQSRWEVERSRDDVREERREYRDAQRYGDRRDIREERREYQDARREYRRDLRDWREARYYDRRYVRPGVRVYSSYYSPRYVISRPWDYRLPRSYGHQRWVRHGRDFLLIDVRNGYVRRVIYR